MGQRSSRSSGTAAASAPPEPQDHGSIDYGRVMHMLHNQLRNRKQRAAAAAPAAAETAAAGGDGGGEAAANETASPLHERGVRLDYLIEFLSQHASRDPAMTTRELVSAVVRPATKHTQRCMWEQLPADARGKPTAAISHAWDYTVTYLRDMLQNGLRGHAPLSGHTFVWLDILALTQHADGSGHQRGEIAQLGRIFGYLVPAVMQVVPAESQVHKRWFHRRNQVLGNPASSTSGGRGDLGAFDRAWCVFELANALRAGAIYDVLCPDANTNYTGPCMLTGAWNPAACKALMASDKANIDDLVLQTFGNWNTLKAMVLMVFLKANNVGPITRWDAQPFAMTAPWGMAFAGSGDVRDTLGGWQEFVDFYYEYYYEFSRQDKSQAAIAAAGLRAEGLEDLRR